MATLTRFLLCANRSIDEQERIKGEIWYSDRDLAVLLLHHDRSFEATSHELVTQLLV